MQHTRFQVPKPSGSKEDDFLIFFNVFLWLNSGHPGMAGWMTWSIKNSTEVLDKLKSRTFRAPSTSTYFNISCR